MQKTLGLTVFMVTHDLASLNTVCDRVAALAHGKIVAIGPMRELLQSQHPWAGPISTAKCSQMLQPKASYSWKPALPSSSAPSRWWYIAAVFGFVYWPTTPAWSARDLSRRVRGPVPVLVGAAVLFNGIRVGEVSELGLAPANRAASMRPSPVAATTPVRADTKVGLEFQGLTGVPMPRKAVCGRQLRRGADTCCGTWGRTGDYEAARDALRKVDWALYENSGAEGHHRQLQDFLGRPARGKLDGIVAGLERMTGVTAPPASTTYDLRAVRTAGPAGKTINVHAIS